jgi:hypothetical protein
LQSKGLAPIPTPDFILVSTECAVERGYLFEFADPEERESVVLSVLFNASPSTRFKAAARGGVVPPRAVYKRKASALVERD